MFRFGSELESLRSETCLSVNIRRCLAAELPVKLSCHLQTIPLYIRRDIIKDWFISNLSMDSLRQLLPWSLQKMLLFYGSSADSQSVCCVFSGQDGLALAAHQLNVCKGSQSSAVKLCCSWSKWDAFLCKKKKKFTVLLLSFVMPLFKYTNVAYENIFLQEFSK